MPTEAQDLSLNAAFAEEGAFSVSFFQKRKHHKYREVAAPVLEGPVADTHAHLQMLKNPAAELAKCAYHGVQFVCAMCDPADGVGGDGAGERALPAGHDGSQPTFERLEEWAAGAAAELQAAGLGEYASRIPELRIAVGVHPHNARLWDMRMERLMLRRLADPRVCALGEVGLDYHYDLSPRAAQRGVFRRQIQLAKLAGLPLILHMREAHEEGLAILEEEGFPEGGVLLHCFNLDEQALEPWAQHGCFIAYGGPITFKKADEVRAAAVKVPRGRLLTETDSPYMTPEPMRGVDCGPAHVVFTAQKLQEVLGCETAQQREELLGQMYANALGLLNRQPTEWQRAAFARLQG